MKVVSPVTDYEVALSLRVLEGCCLLHSVTADMVHKYKAVKVLISILSTRGVIEQGACLDALISLMLEPIPNQMDFEECDGIGKITELMDDNEDKNMRLKCGEFLLLLIGHVSGRENPPLATIHEDIRRLLGENVRHLYGRLASWINSRSRAEAGCLEYPCSKGYRGSGAILMEFMSIASFLAFCCTHGGIPVRLIQMNY